MNKKIISLLIFVLSAAMLLSACGTGTVPSGGEPAASLLVETMNITEEQEAAMLDVFSTCGIGEITTASVVQEGAERTSYHLKDAETSHYTEPIVVFVNNTTKVVETIYYADQDILIDEVPVSMVTLYYVSEQQRETARLAVQTALAQILKNPDIAEYKTLKNWGMGVIDAQIVVQSEVTCLNDLNVKQTLEFQAIFDQLTAEMTSLTVDGTEYIK